jgi:hypothetical protein
MISHLEFEFGITVQWFVIKINNIVNWRSLRRIGKILFAYW